MQGELAPRRTQFSSCDECRRSRVACDAAARAKEDGVSAVEEAEVSCSRCLHRKKTCTFEWVKENKGAPTKAKKTKPERRAKRRKQSLSVSDAALSSEALNGSASSVQRLRSPGASDQSSPRGAGGRGQGPPSALSAGFTPENSHSPSILDRGHSVEDLLTPDEFQWLLSIYRQGFDTVFGSWMGRFCNPFVAGQFSRADKYVCVPDLCKQLDLWMANETLAEPPNCSLDVISDGQLAKCRQIDESLRTTMASFAARWLPLVSKSTDGQEQQVIQALWRHVRRDMLRVINRPSYRSMFTLFLFALTPIPTGISEEEEADGISGQACVHAALQQIQMLRARQRNLQFSGSKVSPFQTKQPVPAGQDSEGASKFIDAESIAYWAALTFDTSASLTLNCRSLLSSGLFGFDEEISWRLVRSVAQMFSVTALQWKSGSVDMTDDQANQIVGAAAAWKLLGWKLTAVFKEALRDGHDEIKVRQAYASVVESIGFFNTTFRPHLETCQRRMHFLGQQTKLRWYSLMLHYHLSILMLIDIIEATDRFDLLADLQEVKLEAENTVMNTLVFGLHNTYSLSMRPNTAIETGEESISTKAAITVPLTAIDPYPHHILAGVQLVRKAIERDFSNGKISEESCSNLQSTLECTLELLPQNSKSVQAARTKSSEKSPGAPDHADPYKVLHAHLAD